MNISKLKLIVIFSLLLLLFPFVGCAKFFKNFNNNRSTPRVIHTTPTPEIPLITPTVNQPKLNEKQIVPGKSAGEFVIGDPIPESSYKTLGKPSSFSDPQEYKDSGSCLWTGIILVKLNDGKDKNNIFTLYIYSPEFQTEKGIKVGDPASRVKELYPNGKEEPAMDNEYSWTCPDGISFYIYQDKVTCIALYSPDSYK